MASSSSYRRLKLKDSIPAAPPTATANAVNPADSVPSVITPAPEDVHLANATHLTREEVIRRRSHNVKQLAKCYREHYWELMEEVGARHREYVWKYGLSPFQEEDKEEEKNGGEEEKNGDPEDEIVEVVEETHDADIAGSSTGSTVTRCAFHGCKQKAMALTSFCFRHILSDPRQQLYKPCTHVVKSGQDGPLTCGKPVLRSTVPCLCKVHLQKAQLHVNRALKKAGSNISSPNRNAPQLHVVVSEFVRAIQVKRRATLRKSKRAMNKPGRDN